MKNLLYVLSFLIIFTLTVADLTDKRKSITLQYAYLHVQNKQGEYEDTTIDGFNFLEFQNRFDPSYIDHYIFSFYKTILNIEDRQYAQSYIDKQYKIDKWFLVENTMNFHFTMDNLVEVSYRDEQNGTYFDFKIQNADQTIYSLSVYAIDIVQNEITIKQLKELIDIKNEIK